jgi:hypothetical protein
MRYVKNTLTSTKLIKGLEKIKLECDNYKEREIPEVNWIYKPPGSGKTAKT